MVDYRIYCLDGAGKICFAEPITAGDDAEAIEKARNMKNGAIKCEVWQGARLVATLNAQDLSPDPA
ncbi:hypothetical protein ACUXST_002522 [Sphingomonas sp. F9_3S_D5_B_2]